jgi:hypothetical protein
MVLTLVIRLLRSSLTLVKWLQREERQLLFTAGLDLEELEL